MTDSYKSDFKKFLSHTDEKQVLLSEIEKDIEKCHAKSLLDIGAGDGILSIPLSRRIKTYVAIEPNQSFVEELRNAGLIVIEGKFPLEVRGMFDLVLSSHSISYERDLYEPFVRKAWSLLAPRGILLIITYRGQEDNWTSLMKNLGESPMDYNRVGFNKIIELLYSLGDVKTRKVSTYVKTENLEDMVETLSFVASNGKLERKAKFLQHRPRLEKVLDSQYKDTAGYSFPFQHFFISTLKVR